MGAASWSRLGHDVRLIPPQYAKPYVKRNKTDAADAEAICEAVGRPNMRFVPDQDERAARRCWRFTASGRFWCGSAPPPSIRSRGLLGEFGLVAPKGIRRVGELQAAAWRRRARASSPTRRAAALTALFDHLDALTMNDSARSRREILAWHKTSEESQRLATAPGVGPLTATALVAAIGDGAQFQSARHFAAWLGLTPRISASGGREHIGRISKGGDRYLRTLLIHGARAMVGTTFRQKVEPRPWLQALMARRPINVAAIAVAHKTARALWAMLRRGEAYRRPASLEAAA